MKTTSEHLPEDKQPGLREIAAIFTDPTVAVPVEMLILFGSHARGDSSADQPLGVGFSASSGVRYERRKLERTLLHRIV